MAGAVLGLGGCGDDGEPKASGDGATSLSTISAGSTGDTVGSATGTGDGTQTGGGTGPGTASSGPNMRENSTIMTALPAKLTQTHARSHRPRDTRSDTAAVVRSKVIDMLNKEDNKFILPASETVQKSLTDSVISRLMRASAMASLAKISRAAR